VAEHVLLSDQVADLRKELEARSLSSKGLKSQLIARLTKALKSEQEKEQQEAENKDEQVIDHKNMFSIHIFALTLCA
jgi:hypothetical protein